MSTDSVILDAPAAARPVSPADDLFMLGRRAAAARDAAFGRRGTFARTRQLLGNGTWRGPRDAAEPYVEEDDLAALGGWAAAAEAGVVLLLGAGPAALSAARQRDDGDGGGARVLLRVPFRNGEDDAERLARLRALTAATAGAPLWGVVPAPAGEPYGLDTVRFVALCRLTLPAAWHVAADVAALGPRLAQMCFGFGADELRAPIVAERALRLGANSNNPALTRKEAITLIRGAGLAAAERLGDGTTEEAT